jgi:Ni/Co efflux regulator RcnB
LADDLYQELVSGVAGSILPAAKGAFMKKFVCTSLLAFSMAGTIAVPVVAQDADHHDQMNRDDHHDDSAYRNNQYYSQGWKDGQRHKHRNKRWKNDADRQAYEAGYAHGDHGDRMDMDHHDHDHN